ncbi:Low complexity with large Glu repeat [Cryptosporidium bovis]|uniref:Low complexity with large Glu repeat n=1 Tax=Cryptosporidium bovis TaxID=310047 RepID=UPI00351A8DD8|nr:Low complexity with large Glu repeat [Cryptosporidium bovis]
MLEVETPKGNESKNEISKETNIGKSSMNEKREFKINNKEDFEYVKKILDEYELSRKSLQEEVHNLVLDNEDLKLKLKSSNDLLNYWKEEYEICNSSLELVTKELEQLKIHDENMNTFNKCLKTIECSNCGNEWKNVTVENDEIMNNERNLNNYVDITNILVSSLFISNADNNNDREIICNGNSNVKNVICEKDQQIEKLKKENSEYLIQIKSKNTLISELRDEICRLKSRIVITENNPTNLINITSDIESTFPICSEDDKIVIKDFGMNKKSRKRKMELVSNIDSNKHSSNSYIDDVVEVTEKEMRLVQEYMSDDDDKVNDKHSYRFDECVESINVYNSIANKNTQFFENNKRDNSGNDIDATFEMELDVSKKVEMDDEELGLENDWGEDDLDEIWKENEQATENIRRNNKYEQLFENIINDHNTIEYNKDTNVDNNDYGSKGINCDDERSNSVKNVHDITYNDHNISSDGVKAIASLLDDFVSHISGSLEEEKDEEEKKDNNIKSLFDSINDRGSINYNKVTVENKVRGLSGFTGLVSNIRNFFNEDVNQCKNSDKCEKSMDLNENDKKSATLLESEVDLDVKNRNNEVNINLDENKMSDDNENNINWEDDEWLDSESITSVDYTKQTGETSEVCDGVSNNIDDKYINMEFNSVGKFICGENDNIVKLKPSLNSEWEYDDFRELDENNNIEKDHCASENNKHNFHNGSLDNYFGDPLKDEWGFDDLNEGFDEIEGNNKVETNVEYINNDLPIKCELDIKSDDLIDNLTNLELDREKNDNKSNKCELNKYKEGYISNATESESELDIGEKSHEIESNILNSELILEPESDGVISDIIVSELITDSDGCDKKDYSDHYLVEDSQKLYRFADKNNDENGNLLKVEIGMSSDIKDVDNDDIKSYFEEKEGENIGSSGMDFEPEMNSDIEGRECVLVREPESGFDIEKVIHNERVGFKFEIESSYENEENNIIKCEIKSEYDFDENKKVNLESKLESDSEGIRDDNKNDLINKKANSGSELESDFEGIEKNNKKNIIYKETKSESELESDFEGIKDDNGNNITYKETKSESELESDFEGIKDDNGNNITYKETKSESELESDFEGIKDKNKSNTTNKEVELESELESDFEERKCDNKINTTNKEANSESELKSDSKGIVDDNRNDTTNKETKSKLESGSKEEREKNKEEKKLNLLSNIISEFEIGQKNGKNSCLIEVKSKIESITESKDCIKVEDELKTEQELELKKELKSDDSVEGSLLEESNNDSSLESSLKDEWECNNWEENVKFEEVSNRNNKKTRDNNFDDNLTLKKEPNEIEDDILWENDWDENYDDNDSGVKFNADNNNGNILDKFNEETNNNNSNLNVFDTNIKIGSAMIDDNSNVDERILNLSDDDAEKESVINWDDEWSIDQDELSNNKYSQAKNDYECDINIKKSNDNVNNKNNTLLNNLSCNLNKNVSSNVNNSTSIDGWDNDNDWNFDDLNNEKDNGVNESNKINRNEVDSRNNSVWEDIEWNSDDNDF